MQIATNLAALFTQRQQSQTEQASATVLQRLSSGMRVNSAKDDAAGLAISERMSAQIRGNAQARRNASDGVSLVQTAEGALGSSSDLLQRVRELAVQAANGSNSAADRRALQAEASQLLQTIDKIGRDTQFNGVQVFSQSTAHIGGDVNRRAIMDGLQVGWLEASEQRVKQYYGITADGATLTVNLDTSDGAGGTLASVSGTVGGDGKINNQSLNIDMADFTPPNLPNGGTAPVYNDRIIAHEMTHAIMGRTMNFNALPTWFKEGSAELIHGADERANADINASGQAAVINQVAAAWGGASIDYSSAYIASRYLHETLKNEGHPEGIKAVMQYLNANQGQNLDDALNSLTGGTFATAAAFIASFTGGNVAVGQNFVNTKMNFTNTDTGAVGGLDADAGAILTAESVIGDTGSRAGEQVLDGFRLVNPTLGGTTVYQDFQLQVGAKQNQTITASIGAINTQALGLDGTDLNTMAQMAIYRVDRALNYVNDQRAKLGAMQSRLEASMGMLDQQVETGSAARSRIRDTDFAKESTELARQNILRQAGSSMLAQANSAPQQVLTLLR